MNGHLRNSVKPKSTHPSLAIDDVIDKDIMLHLRPLSYGSATELKSIMLTPPLSERLFIDSLRLEYFSRFLSRFDLKCPTKKNCLFIYSDFIEKYSGLFWIHTAKWEPCILFLHSYVLWPSVVVLKVLVGVFCSFPGTIQHADQTPGDQMIDRIVDKFH